MDYSRVVEKIKKYRRLREGYFGCKSEVHRQENVLYLFLNAIRLQCWPKPAVKFPDAEAHLLLPPLENIS
jgi:hypothetical protein